MAMVLGIKILDSEIIVQRYCANQCLKPDDPITSIEKQISLAAM